MSEIPFSFPPGIKHDPDEEFLGNYPTQHPYFTPSGDRGISAKDAIDAINNDRRRDRRYSSARGVRPTFTTDGKLIPTDTAVIAKLRRTAAKR